MTPSQAMPNSEPRPEPRYWARSDTAQAYAAFADPSCPPCSQREYAQQQGIPRSTLGHWLRQDLPEHLDKEFVSFFRCPAGQAFLRRLVFALLLAFHHASPCGLRPISSFLERIDLHYFVGSSYGALYNLDQHLQAALVLFGQEERQRLAVGMTEKDISVCLDENFHGPQNCLVSIEPVSNFILIETYRDQRDSVTWATVLAEGIKDLPVHIVALTSDQASGLIRCAEKELEVIHRPDLMHLQQALFQPLLLPLARPIQQADKDLEKAKRKSDRLEQAEEEQPDSVPLDTMIESVRAEMLALESREQAQESLEQAVEQIREVSFVYHPFDRETGQAVTVEQMQARLSAPLDRLQEVVEEAELGERARQAVQKARGWVVLLVGCLAWFRSRTDAGVEKLGLSEEGQRLVKEYLLPSCYWEMASAREKIHKERKRGKELARQLREKAWAKGGALAALAEGERQEVERVARQCAGLFCRSSSCVEGRNGRLSLFHHGQTRLSEQRLKALTAVHNYVVRRADGTTAAERFFGQKQRDAFSWLLDRLPELPRPAAKRRQQPAQQATTAA
jgi:Family of unknown function (DUF6399)